MFLFVSAISAILAFGGISGIATETARILFAIFATLFLLSLIKTYVK